MTGAAKALWDLAPDDLQGHLPDFLPDVHDVREDVADYLGECLAVDAGLGVILARLEAIGELDNTLVVVSGDHGIPGFPRAKCNLYDIGCEVALAARWAGRIPAGRAVDDAVNLMDLAPTFLEAAAVDIPDSMTGRSLLPVLESAESGLVDEQRTFVVLGRERHEKMGLGNIFKVCGIAEAAEALVACHQAQSPLCTAINAHLHAAIPNFLIHENFDDSLEDWTWDVLQGAPRVVDGGC
jgi:arylsulfatase A-like enzyme